MRSESKYPFLLRSYTFHSNHTFNVVQIFYEDEFCSSPMYAVSAIGYLNLHWNSNGQLNYRLTRVAIVLHHITVAKDLSLYIRKACPNMTADYWKPSVEYEIFNVNRMEHRKAKSRNNVEDNNADAGEVSGLL